MKNPTFGNDPGLPSSNSLDVADILNDVQCAIDLIQMVFRNSGGLPDRVANAVYYIAQKANDEIERAVVLLMKRGEP